jgi:uncharacterized protein
VYRSIAACLFLLLALSQSAVAQPAGDIDPEAVKVARELMVVTQVTANLELIVDAMGPSVVEMLKRDRAELPDEVIAKFIVEFRAEMLKGFPQLIEMYARVYAQRFTLAELKETAKFYQSPLGQKFIRETPLILKETLPLGEQLGQKVGEQAAINAIEKLRAQGVKI